MDLAPPDTTSRRNSETSSKDSAAADLADVLSDVGEKPPRSKKESSSQYLEALSRSILDVGLNLKDRGHPIVLKHQSPDFRSKHDALPQTTSRDAHHSNLDKHLAQQVDFHIEVLNTSSEVDDSRGRATVYVWYEISGLAHGLEREAVALLSWERKQGTWMLMKHTGLFLAMDILYFPRSILDCGIWNSAMNVRATTPPVEAACRGDRHRMSGDVRGITRILWTMPIARTKAFANSVAKVH